MKPPAQGWIPSRWTFKNRGVARNFDNHVREQLPWYDAATKAVAFLALHYVPKGGLVYDVGASTGNISRALAPVLAERGARLIAVEESAEMAKLYDGPGEIVVADAMSHDFQPFDFCVVFLTAMFLPVDGRGKFLIDLWRKTKQGGALVIVDKTECDSPYVSTILRRMTMQQKVDAGAKPEEVLRKELSLAGVQRPMSKSAIPPGAVEFFRFGEFAGWVVENPEQNPFAYSR